MTVPDENCSRCGFKLSEHGIPEFQNEVGCSGPTDDERDEEHARHELELSGDWHVANIIDADWALGRVGDLRAEAAELETLYNAAVERAKLKRDMLLQRIERGERFFVSQLRLYAERHKEELLKSGKKKTRALMNGSVGWKKASGRLAIVDSAKCLEWCRKQPVESGALRIKEEPALSVLQAKFKEAGEVPPGCEVTADVEEFVCKTDKEKDS